MFMVSCDSRVAGHVAQAIYASVNLRLPLLQCSPGPRMVPPRRTYALHRYTTVLRFTSTFLEIAEYPMPVSTKLPTWPNRSSTMRLTSPGRILRRVLHRFLSRMASLSILRSCLAYASELVLSPSERLCYCSSYRKASMSSCTYIRR